MRIGNLVSLSFLLCFLCSCSLFGDKLTLKESSFEEISGWQDDNHNDALVSFLQSCKKFESLPEDRPAHDSGVAGTYGDWKKVCRNAVSGQYPDPKRFFESNFRPYLAKNWWNTKGTFTGYYEIELNGSRTRHGSYLYPLYFGIYIFGTLKVLEHRIFYLYPHEYILLLENTFDQISLHLTKQVHHLTVHLQ